MAKTPNLNIELTTDDLTLFETWRNFINGTDATSMASIVDAFAKEIRNGKLNKNISALTQQTTANLTDNVLINRNGVDYRTTVSAILEKVAVPDLFIVVTELPTTGVTNRIYLAPSATQVGTFDEYIWVDNKFELIGGVTIDLSNYYTKAEVDSKLSNASPSTASLLIFSPDNVEMIIGRHTVEDVDAWIASQQDGFEVYVTNIAGNSLKEFTLGSTTVEVANEVLPDGYIYSAMLYKIPDNKISLELMFSRSLQGVAPYRHVELQVEQGIDKPNVNVSVNQYGMNTSWLLSDLVDGEMVFIINMSDNAVNELKIPIMDYPSTGDEDMIMIPITDNYGNSINVSPNDTVWCKVYKEGNDNDGWNFQAFVYLGSSTSGGSNLKTINNIPLTVDPNDEETPDKYNITIGGIGEDPALFVQSSDVVYKAHSDVLTATNTMTEVVAEDPWVTWGEYTDLVENYDGDLTFVVFDQTNDSVAGTHTIPKGIWGSQYGSLTYKLFNIYIPIDQTTGVTLTIVRHMSESLGGDGYSIEGTIPENYEVKIYRAYTNRAAA